MQAKTQNQLLLRISKVQVHLASVRQMVLQNAPHDDLSLQLRALCGSLQQIESVVIQDGLYACLEQAHRDKPEVAIERVMRMLNLHSPEGDSFTGAQAKSDHLELLRGRE